MAGVERTVRGAKSPHEWARSGSAWRCRRCGAAAAEFDDDGAPDPYGKVVHKPEGMDCVEADCDELSVLKVMGA